MPAPKRKPLGEGNTYADEVIRAWDRMTALNEARKCRVCGCTEYRACKGGCWWVEDELCSSCQDGQP